MENFWRRLLRAFGTLTLWLLGNLIVGILVAVAVKLLGI